MKVYQKSTEDVKEIIKKTEINMLYEKASQGFGITAMSSSLYGNIPHLSDAYHNANVIKSL